MFFALFSFHDEKKATVNVYWGHWEGPLFTLDTASGYTHTHITYGSCVPITQKHTSKQRHEDMHSHFAEAKAYILPVHVGIDDSTLSLLPRKSRGLDVIFLAHILTLTSAVLASKIS